MRDWRAYVRERLPRLNVPPAREMEIVNELAQQLEQACGEAADEEALQIACAQFPDWNALAREIDEAERWAPAPWFSGLPQDIRYALRLLIKSPAFAAIAICTLAFGIGANTAIFTVVDALALRALPYDSPAQLMAIETRQAKQPEVEPWTSALDFFDLRDRNHAFASIAAVSPIWNVVLTGRGDAERLETLFVSAELFPILGTKPVLGRTFLPQEDRRTTPSNVVILSYAFWQRRFGGDRAVLRQVLNLDGSACTVVGVLPANFRYLGEPVSGTASDIDLWMPLASNQIVASARSVRFLKVVGRRKPGVSPEQARDDVRNIGDGLAAQYTDTNRGYAMYTESLGTQIAGRLRPTLFLLLIAVAFVLLIACANVANLLLARTLARQNEISMRIALGASGFRPLRQLLVEGVMLALIGGVAGLLLAQVALRIFVALGPAGLVHGRDIVLDYRALLFTTFVVFASAILSGLPPAWRMLRSQISGSLREASRGRRIRSALVVAEIALALTLLTGAGLLLHSFVKLLDVSPGFNAQNLVTLTTQISAPPAQRAATYRLMRDRLLATAGVRDVAAVSRLPLTGSNLGSWLYIEHRVTGEANAPQVEFRRCTFNYFSAMGIPLLRGRLMEERDDAGVALINESTARKFFNGENPIGQRIKLGPNSTGNPWLSIAGVVADVRHFGLEVDPRPEVYVPIGANPLNSPILVIRTAADPRPLIPALTAAVRSANAACPVYNVMPMEELVARSTLQRRFIMSLLIAFAGAALLLAAVGIYGTASQSVAQRTPEIGLRMALGATPAEALGLILAEALRVTLAGTAIGLLLAAALARLMKSLLFGVSPFDVTAFALAAMMLGILSIIACLAPALRATRVDPLVALRHD